MYKQHGSSQLSEQINDVNRHEHVLLNKLIIARLPLCLPPHSSDPLAYALGIQTFAPIYYTIEEEWQALLTSQSTAKDTESPQCCIQLVKNLYTPALSRSARLQSDLKQLLCQFDATDAQYLTRRIASRSSQTAQQIANSIRRRPHVLFAYSWVMYMALFSGGRWIRKQLKDGGSIFWTGKLDEGRAQNSDWTAEQLSMWFFDSAVPEDQIKRDFKTKFEHLASCLTPEEVGEVISESRSVFQLCIDSVHFLDDLIISSQPTTPIASHQLVQPTKSISRPDQSIATGVSPASSLILQKTRKWALFVILVLMCYTILPRRENGPSALHLVHFSGDW